MMNRIVQTMIDNGTESTISLGLDSSRLDLMLDMFPDDVSLGDYMAVTGKPQNSPEC